MTKAAFQVTEKYFRAACIRVLTPERVDRIINAMATRAENGDVSATTVLRDTIDGKPSQEITGANGGPISLEFSVKYETTPELKTIDHEPLTGLESHQEDQGTPENG